VCIWTPPRMFATPAQVGAEGTAGQRTSPANSMLATEKRNSYTYNLPAKKQKPTIGEGGSEHDTLPA
jgi:hypothetical protein